MAKPSPWIDIRKAFIEVFSAVAVDQITSEGGVNLPFETPEWRAEWKERRAEFIHPLQGHALYLKIGSIVGRGWDDWSFDEQDTGLVAGKEATGNVDVFQTVSGLRRITLQIQSWCLEESDEISSINIIERLRTHLEFDSSRQRLLAANIDFTDFGPSRDMTATVKGKRYSITAAELVFNACVIETDTIPTGYFSRIILTSHEQAGGEDVRSVLRMIEETLPPEDP